MTAPARFRSAALVLSGAALFGTIGTAQALGPDLPVAQLTAARLVLAGAILVLIAVAAGHLSALPDLARQPPSWWAGVGQVGFNLCFLGAMTQAGVAVGTLVAIGATPIITGLATRSVTPTWLVATGVALVGLVLLVAGQRGTDSAPSPLGIALALGAATSYATYIIAGQTAAARHLPTQPFLAVAFSIAALVTLPLLLVGEVSTLVSGDAAWLVGYLAVVATVLAYSLFNRGLHGVRSATAATLGLVEPVVAALLAFAVLGERLSVVGLVGAALVLLGLLLIVRSAGSARSSAPVG